MLSKARAVVIGGGVGGCSILYWLARLGWGDVVLCERADLTSGSTFHSAGLVGQLRGSLSLTRMMMASVDLYRSLGDEVGLETGWHEVGSLRLASSEERMEELRRQAGWAKTFGLPLDLVTADEYLITRPHGVPLDVPTMRDPSLLVYFRGESGGLVMGGYERHPAPWGLDGIPPDFNGRLLAEDWERFEELMTNALVRVPELGEAEVIRLVNGPEAFTPDGEFILGPTELPGFWIASGFCAHGLAGAGGMGKLVAEWIVDGLPGFDVWEMDSRRFGAHYASRDYTLARTHEIYSTYYDVKYPGHEREAGRPLRVSPTYERLRELGAVFGEKSGWERANWFETNGPSGRHSLRPRWWSGRLWSPALRAASGACSARAALR